jgi:murein DD-endopeptidase MepM/ murein hydrolase activator NlpD
VAVTHNQPDQEITKIWTAADANIMGNYIRVQHGPNLYSLYVHMMHGSATVSVGDYVGAGQVIGKIGNSGLTGNVGIADGQPHLHFGFYDASGQGAPALFWNIGINRLSDAELQTAIGRVPDIRQQNFNLTPGNYIVQGGTPLEFDIVTGP